MLASSFFACQFAMAESNNFSNLREASFELNLKMASALSTWTPLIKSATKRIFLGDVGQLFNFAKAICFFSALIFSAISLFRTPIAYFFPLFLAPAWPLKDRVGENSPNL